MYKTVELIRCSFGRDLEFEDCYNHLTGSDVVYLGYSFGEMVVMSCYNRVVLSGFPSLIEEGIVVDPSFQGKKIFETITDVARKDEAVICLRTQNPFMYKALFNYCSRVYPSLDLDFESNAIRAVRESLEEHLGCEGNEEGVVKGYYGGLFYGEEPYHSEITPFFKKQLNMNLHEGDALLVVGIK